MFSVCWSPRSRIWLTRGIAASFVGLLLIAVEGWQITNPVFEHGLRWIGWALLAVGVIGRCWCGSYISGYKNDRLITDGPYSLCRNPLYFFSFLAGLGLMFITETLIMPAAFCVVYLGYYAQVIRAEEKYLASLHGDKFTDYMQLIPRFWPSSEFYREPENYLVSTRHYRRHLAEAIWFIILGGGIEFIEALHNAKVLPVYFHLY
jgi:protein-S-isoprenylcysteine O-methyltransferase Ste14